jgi:hypothetical protein
MMAVLKLYYMRQETYSSAMLALHQAQTVQHRLQGHVHKLRKAARDAQTHIANAMIAMEARRNQFVNAVRERDEAYAQRNTAWADMRAIRMERDDTICLAQTRNNARIMAGIQAEIRVNELLR